MDFLRAMRGITRPTITLAVTITACSLAILIYMQSDTIPEWFIATFSMITGYWFGSRNGQDDK